MKANEPVKVLRVFAEGPDGVITVVQASEGSWGIYSEADQTMVMQPQGACVMIQADMVAMTRAGEVQALALFLRNAADWLKEQQGGK